MLKQAVEDTLQRTVDWLLKHNDAPSWWNAHTDHAEMCLSEMVRMSQPVPDPTRGSVRRSALHPLRQNLLRAVPHVQNMIASMRKRDRVAALKSGQGRWRKLYGHVECDFLPGSGSTPRAEASAHSVAPEAAAHEDKVKPDEIRGEMTGLRTTMEKVLHPPRATMLFTFAPCPDPVVLGGPVIPLRDITLPLNPDGSVHVRFTFINNSVVVAEVLQVSLEICRGCKFAKEPEGFTRIPGARETERNHLYGDAPARGAVADLAADVIPPPGASGFGIRLRYLCKTCVLEPDGTEGTIHIQRN